MQLSKKCVMLALCLILVSCVDAIARDSVLAAIPDDAVGFAVIHNLGDVNHSIGELAKLLKSPAPDLLAMAKGMSGLQNGVDEQGDLAVVITSVDPAPKRVVLIPVAKFDDFFKSLNAKEPASGVVEAQITGRAMVVGRKGDHAAIASADDRDALEKFLSSTKNLAGDRALSDWLDANKASLVVTSSGLQQLFPKLIAGIQMMQAQVQKAAGEQGKAAADAMDLYVKLFNKAQSEVEQVGFGVRIDSALTTDLVSRLRLTQGGDWAKKIAEMKPVSEDLLADLPAGPFVVAGGGVIPKQAFSELIKASMQMQQNREMFKLSPEQAKEYAELSAQAMQDVHAMRMRMGVAAPDAGLYGNTVAVFTVDDSKRYMDQYEKTLVAMKKLAEETKSPGLPQATTQSIKVGDVDGLEVMMTLPSLKQAVPPGTPDPEKFMKLFTGPEGKIKMYIAPADEHTVVMAYTSRDLLEKTMEAHKAKQPGLAADANVAKVVSALPAGSQVIGFMSLSGFANMMKQFVASMPGGRADVIPQLPESPAMGFAAKFDSGGIEGHAVLLADTLRAIGDTVAKKREHAEPPSQ